MFFEGPIACLRQAGSVGPDEAELIRMLTKVSALEHGIGQFPKLN